MSDVIVEDVIRTMYVSSDEYDCGGLFVCPRYVYELCVERPSLPPSTPLNCGVKQRKAGVLCSACRLPFTLSAVSNVGAPPSGKALQERVGDKFGIPSSRRGRSFYALTRKLLWYLYVRRRKRARRALLRTGELRYASKATQTG